MKKVKTVFIDNCGIETDFPLMSREEFNRVSSAYGAKWRYLGSGCGYDIYDYTQNGEDFFCAVPDEKEDLDKSHGSMVGGFGWDSD
jgi:hypothetical protein